MQPNKGIHVEETDASLRLSWNNRTANKKRFLGLVLFAFWVVWTPITLIVTNGAFEKARGFHVIPWFAGLLLAWVCELGVPYALLARQWSESIALDKAAITLTFSGPLARKGRVIPLEAVREIWLGHFGSGEDRESIVTLNLLLTEPAPSWSRRQMIGYWLSYELQRQLFLAIEAFVEMHNLDIRMTHQG